MSPVSCLAGSTPYIIKAGDTCSALAQRFGSTVQAVQSANFGLICNNLQIGR